MFYMHKSKVKNNMKITILKAIYIIHVADTCCTLAWISVFVYLLYKVVAAFLG